ncbi:ATP-binding protein, partial [Bacillus pumilus]
HLWILYEKGVEDTFQNFTFNIPLIITSLTVSIVVPAAILFGWRYIFRKYSKLKKIYHRQKIARMILSNKFYDSKSVKSRITDRMVQKITYFPRFYYRVKDGHI